ncbi:MAG: NAD(P)/FAD-dependent oxidoreductase [Candidatus Cybelea sp.]
MQPVQIAVVGGGPAGLSTAGALIKLGAKPVVFDRNARIGDSWRRRYDRLHLHTTRRFSGLAHYQIPRSYPRYLSRDMYAEYLQLYAEQLAIDVALGCSVETIGLAAWSDREKPAFDLQTSKGRTLASAVVVATGMFGEPVTPRVAGLEDYCGMALHACAYQSGKAFAAKRVLVVGLGNTGAEIATDLVDRGAEYVAVSVRSTPPVVLRDLLGVPVQLFGIALSRVAPATADRIGQALSRLAIGDLSRYGLRAPDWLPFSSRRIPVIDVGFLGHLKRGTVTVRPTIARFTERGVLYGDGFAEEFDAVIFATGYRTGLERLLQLPGVLDDAGFPRARMGEPTVVPGLYFMGFVHSHRGLLFEIERASRRLARHWLLDVATQQRF